MSEVTITDCDEKMSNGKRVDIWTEFRTVLKKNPGIKAKYLLLKLRKRIDLSKSTIYYHLSSWELQKRYYRENAKYYLPDDWRRYRNEIENKVNKTKRLPGKWEVLKEELGIVGGYLLDLEHQKLKLGDRDPETGWPKENYDQVIPIQGIIFQKGATDLAAAVPIIIPEKYDAFIYTPSLVNEVIRPDDQIYWRDKRKLYKVKKIDEISDPYETSYVILKVVKIRII